MSHTLINCTCQNRLGFSLLPFTLIPQYPKRFNWSKTRWNKGNLKAKQWNSLSFRLFSLASMVSIIIFPDRMALARSVRSGKHMLGLGFFCRSRQSNISTSAEERFKYPLPWENKIGQMPYPRANKDNQIHTPYPASPHPTHRRHNIIRCIIFKPAILLKFIHFQLRIQSNQLGFLVVLGLPHILIFLTDTFTDKLILRLRCHFAGCSGNFSILERFEMKRLPKWWMSQYVYNKHNATWKVLCTVFTHSLFLYQKSKEWT